MPVAVYQCISDLAMIVNNQISIEFSIAYLGGSSSIKGVDSKNQ